jgi:hypothetical protein
MSACHGVQYRLHGHEPAVTLQERDTLLGRRNALSIATELRGEVKAMLQLVLVEIGIAREAASMLHLESEMLMIGLKKTLVSCEGTMPCSWESARAYLQLIAHIIRVME